MSFRSLSLAAVSLLIAAYLLALFTNGFKPEDNATLSVLITYLKTGIIIASFLFGRYIYSLDSEVLSNRFFNSMLTFATLSVTYLAYEAYLSKGIEFIEMSDSLVYFYMYVFLPILVAKPNRFLLKIAAKISRPF